LKILVTGSAGFIGINVALRLLELGHEVIGCDKLNDYSVFSLEATPHSVRSFAR